MQDGLEACEPGRGPEGGRLWGRRGPLAWLPGSGGVAEATSWHRPLWRLPAFLCTNAIFWFLALNTMRVYSLLCVFIIALLMLQMMADLALSRMSGVPFWRSLNFSWEVIASKSDCRPWLGQCITESWTNYRAFFEEMSHFKQQNPGKFCLLICSLCTFFTILGSYIPGVVLSYFMLLCAFFCPLLKCHEFGQRVWSKVQPVLQKLDFGVWNYLSQWRKDRAERSSAQIRKDDSEGDLSALYPQVSCSSLSRELSLTDTEASEISLTDNGTFNLSGGYTPQTDTSDDFDRTSDQEDTFIQGLAEFPNLEMGNGSGTDESSIGLPAPQKKRKERQPGRPGRERHFPHPLTSDQAFSLISGIAEDVIGSAVSAAITDQLQAALQVPGRPAGIPSEGLDTDEVDDFELLDQSELEEIEEEQALSLRQDQEEQGKKAKPGFFSSLLGGQ